MTSPSKTPASACASFAQALLAVIEHAGRLALPTVLKDRLAALDALRIALSGREGPTPD